MSESMFDKLGDLLSKALDSGEIPHKDTSLNNDSGDSVTTDTRSSFDSSSGSSKAERIPVPPYTVANALKTLGLTADLTYKEARDAYRKKLKQFHPDKNNSNPIVQNIAKEKTESIIGAWKIAGPWYKNVRFK